MQKDSCCSHTGIFKWIHPTPVHFVAGLIFFVTGIMKVSMWTQSATFMGGVALSLLGINPAVHGLIALILGSIAICVEIIGGFSFMIGCRKTAKYAAIGLAIIAFVILANEIKGGLVKGRSLFSAIQGAQFTLLFFTVFATKAVKTITGFCGARCCGGGCCNGISCCSEETKK